MAAEATRPSPPSRSEGAERLALVAIDGDGRPLEPAGLDELEAAMADPGVRFWIDVANPATATLERISRALRLHPLLSEDVAERNERAKVERFDEILHVVLFAIAWHGEAIVSEVDFLLADRWLLTVHDDAWEPAAAPQLRRGPATVLAQGTDYLLYAIADALVDGYFPVLDRLTDEVDRLQDEVVESSSQWSLQRLFVLKRELMSIRRATSPTREIFNQLTNRELGLIQPQHVVYFRDVYDHLIRVTDEVDTYRELIGSTLDVYLTSVNNNLSVIMKRLTGVTVILAGMGAVAGLFGMSEAGLAFSGGEAAGFWIVLGGTVMAAVFAAVVLRRSDWI